MLFYMQMRNWFLVFLMVTIAYMIHQKSSAAHGNFKMARASIPLMTLLR